MQRNVKAGAITALTVISLAVGGAAYAYWTDAGTVSTSDQAIISATYVPKPILTCSVTSGQNHVATWSMPDGFSLGDGSNAYNIGYTVTLTNSGSNSWQSVGTVGSQGGQPANLAGANNLLLGGNGTQAIWGLTASSVGIPFTSSNNSGTLTVVARVGNWTSEPTSVNWHINFSYSILGALQANPDVGCDAVGN